MKLRLQIVPVARTPPRAVFAFKRKRLAEYAEVFKTQMNLKFAGLGGFRTVGCSGFTISSSPVSEQIYIIRMQRPSDI